MDHDAKAAKILKYMKQLKNDDTKERALEKLQSIDMTIELLAETKVGKAVNKLQNDDDFGELAYSIVKRWKNVARKAGYEESRQASGSESPEPKINASTSTTSHSSKKTENKEKRVDKEKAKKSVSSAPHNAFEAMLSAGDKTDVKRRTNKFNALLTTADLDTNYRPLPQLKPKPEKVTEDYELKDGLIKYRSVDRAKVFAGRKKTAPRTTVDSLVTICQRVIGNHIDWIEETGIIPFSLLQPVLEKCTPKQLSYIEERNPILEEDGDGLWEQHFKRAHPTERTDDAETWKQAFFRVEREKERRLDSIKTKINKNPTVAGSGRQAILADPMAPKAMRKRQFANNTLHIAKPVPSASEVSKARKQLFDSGDRSSLNALPSVVRNLGSSLGAHKGKKEVKKKGALMAKTMKMLNIKRR